MHFLPFKTWQMLGSKQNFSPNVIKRIKYVKICKKWQLQE